MRLPTPEEFKDLRRFDNVKAPEPEHITKSGVAK
jgi:hypothetical protein